MTNPLDFVRFLPALESSPNLDRAYAYTALEVVAGYDEQIARLIEARGKVIGRALGCVADFWTPEEIDTARESAEALRGYKWSPALDPRTHHTPPPPPADMGAPKRLRGP